MNHTPAPWAVAQRSVGKRQATVVLDADRNEVCEAYDSAALIAAAPELLEALKMCESVLRIQGYANAADIAQAAIAKARVEA